jgi:feruloyl esterase
MACLGGCGGSDDGDGASGSVTLLSCDDSLKSAFKPDANTTVLLAKAFKAGDPLILSGTPTAQTLTAANDLCMVKLNVGPGNPGPADAPSTSQGIGIEIWLPGKARWNNRVHVVGGGGWAGGVQGSTTAIAGATASPVVPVAVPSTIADVEGAVSASTDAGHANAANGGSFAMNPDGTINTALWTDYSSRAIHEMAVKTKALATAFYGTTPKYMYWDGFSTGGRQGMKEAQANPADFDGIVAGAPAMNFTSFITGGLYPQVVFQRDLGGAPLTTAQQDLVSNAAIASCDVVGGQHTGYILDPSACTYDPTKDASVLCASSGGANTTSACVSATQALVMNKIWYGMTADGSVQDPTVDNGWSNVATPSLPTGNQRWFGLSRGTSLYAATFRGIGLASVNRPFFITSDVVALELQDPSIAVFDPTSISFVNATGNGASNWKSLSYAQLSHAYDRGIALQTAFGNVNTDATDLSAFKARNGKLLHYHGLSDELIMPQGSINYYNRVTSQMGGLAAVQPFYRLFLIPGYGHGSSNGTSNPAANGPAPTAGQLYAVLTDWVEKGSAPDSVVMSAPSSTPAARTLPICAYPKKATYTSGDPNVAATYTCN